MRRAVAVVLAVLLAAPAFGAYALEWSGKGDVRRALYWLNPQAVTGRDLPMYPATYIFRVYPIEKSAPDHCFTVSGSCNNRYWTTFFHGNFGDFSWSGDSSGLGTYNCEGGTNDNTACTIGGSECTGGGVCCSGGSPGSGSATSFYGMHPYPSCGGGAPNGTQSWEISVEASDFIDHDSSTAEPSGLECNSPCNTGCEPAWGQWYLQVVRVSSCTGTDTPFAGCLGSGRKLHEFYFDVPEPASDPLTTHKIIRALTGSSTYGNTLPPAPALTWGQTGCLDNGGIATGWGGGQSLGYEEFSGRIRGIQIYNAALSDADIVAEIAAPLSTSAGQNAVWYLNLNPRPTDVLDDSGQAHHPVWDCGSFGAAASSCPNVLEWTDGNNPVPIPAGLTSVIGEGLVLK